MALVIIPTRDYKFTYKGAKVYRHRVSGFYMTWFGELKADTIKGIKKLITENPNLLL